MTKPEPLKIRPYARLLTMLGDQLIKNERIALIELIKNSYDADSLWAKISFIGFERDYGFNKSSKIIIEDAGSGMTETIIKKDWLNPATPEKKKRKEKTATTPKGRIMQGEKGIGRFAILKLGRKIKVITRTFDENLEHVVDYDFSKYDDDFLTENGEDKELFIDNLTVSFQSRIPETIIKNKIHLGIKTVERPPYGTRIEISDLKGSWSEKKLIELYRDIARLESIFPEKLLKKTKYQTKSSFEVRIYKNDQPLNFQEDYKEKFNLLLTDRSVIRIENGYFDNEKNEFKFDLNGKASSLKLNDPQIKGLGSKIFKEYFGDRGHVKKRQKIECGPFQFCFYVFDFSPQVPPKFQLDKEDKTIIRDHRIYLYRDCIRVYPYGEPDDDWLRIDAYRGTISAGQFLSNDQVVGYVSISQEKNPKLKDKTNREGLIEEGDATADFIGLLKLFLAYIRQKPYARYRSDLKDKTSHDIFKGEQIQKDFEELKLVLKDNKAALNLVTQTEKQYKTEREFLVRRAETTEELAGVGLSVETASHDIMAIMGKAMIILDSLIHDGLQEIIDKELLNKDLQTLRGMLSFIEAQLKNIQLLFKSSKQKRRNIKVISIIENVERIYKRLLKKENIVLSIEEIGSPLMAKTTDAVLLQLFLNLFDNSVYWLQQIDRNNKQILIRLDGNKGQLIFSDNGPGVDKDDVPYIFEAFYSGKGEEGRGLGLYIARQLLERNDYSIELAEIKSEKKLSGANFVVNFVSGGDQ